MTHRSLARFGSLLVAWAALACAEDVTLATDETPDASWADAAPDSETGAGVPPGFAGPVVLSMGTDPNPSCDNGDAPVLVGGMGEVSAAGGCAACQCASTLPTCLSATVDVFASTDCTGTPWTAVAPTPNVCTPAGLVGIAAKSARGRKLTTDVVCPASGGEAQLESATYPSYGALCTPSAEEATCVYREGDFPCPPSHPEKTVLFGGVDDSRVCSPCSCGKLEGYSCVAQTDFHEDGNCGGLDVFVVHSEACIAFAAAAPLFAMRYEVNPYPGWCKPSGGELTGTVGSSNPSTVCCAK